MSKLFFDHLIVLEDVDKKIKESTDSSEEREEMWGLVDEIVHHKVLETILDRLPRESHEEFLDLFHKSPHNEELIIGYLKGKISQNIEEILRQELGNLAYDLLEEIKVSNNK
ncbi:MAG: hypothetical protein ACHQUA_01390 [Microgenomates group bacterium]